MPPKFSLPSDSSASSPQLDHDSDTGHVIDSVKGDQTNAGGVIQGVPESHQVTLKDELPERPSWLPRTSSAVAVSSLIRSPSDELHLIIASQIEDDCKKRALKEIKANCGELDRISDDHPDVIEVATRLFDPIRKQLVEKYGVSEYIVGPEGAPLRSAATVVYHDFMTQAAAAMVEQLHTAQSDSRSSPSRTSSPRPRKLQNLEPYPSPETGHGANETTTKKSHQVNCNPSFCLQGF